MTRVYRVLIVEDEPLMRQYLTENLSLLHAGFTVADTARDGNAALSLLEENEYDLIITDIRMPGMDGLTLVERIRAAGNRVSVIILSGYDEFDYARTALRYGVSEYLLKPLKDNELKETLNRLGAQIERRRGEARIRGRPDAGKHLALCRFLLLRNRRGANTARRTRGPLYYDAFCRTHRTIGCGRRAGCDPGLSEQCVPRGKRRILQQVSDAPSHDAGGAAAQKQSNTHLAACCRADRICIG